MAIYASDIVKQAEAWLGYSEASGKHKKIIDIYNAHKPLAVGYKVKYTDAWCSTFVSAVAIKCGATHLIPTECGCGRHIALFKKKGIWVENDAYKPSAGDIIFYDWSDNGKGENTDGASHVGIVQKVVGSKIYVIEGNYGNTVKVRTLQVNGRYIRGYGVPKYDKPAETTTTAPKTESKKVTIELNVLSKGATGAQVKTLQRLLKARGYKMTNGGKTYGVDGSFGQATKNGVIAFQKAKGLAQDGVVGAITWSALLK